MYDKARQFLNQQKDLIVAQRKYPKDNSNTTSTNGISSKLKTLVKLIDQITVKITAGLKPSAYCKKMIELLGQHSIEVQKEFEMADENAEDFSEISTEYFSMIPTYAKLIEDLETMSSETVTTSPAQPVMVHRDVLQLPWVKIPVFDGSYDNWSQFKDLFFELIHLNNMGNAQKMMYLKTYFFPIFIF